MKKNCPVIIALLLINLFYLLLMQSIFIIVQLHEANDGT